jgi:hypothetical protein
VATQEAQRMAAVVATHAPRLRAAGFRKRRHSFNRAVADGLVHVVHFWMAPREPPAWTEVPGLRTRLYGTFRLEVGVHVPEMTRNGTPRSSSWVNEYDCHLRRTAAELLREEGDLWWRLDHPDAAAEAGRVLEDHALPWLDRFPDRASLVAAFEREGPLALGMSPSGPLDVADLHRATGRPDEERRVLEAYVAEPVQHGHAGYLAEHLRERGYHDLVERITVRD